MNKTVLITGSSRGIGRAIAKVLAKHGFTSDVPMPDISTKEKAQAYIGLDMKQKHADKQKFLGTVVPEWIKKAQSRGRTVEL